MASHDEKQLLDLLQVYKSEDTKKARRNLSTLGFIVIAAWLLGVRLSDIKVFGADISHTAESYVLALGLAIVLYWLVIFYLSYNFDVEIQKERSIQLESTVASFNLDLEAIKRNQLEPTSYHPDKAILEGAIDSYSRQKKRTAKAEHYSGFVCADELWVPVVLAVSADAILYIGWIFA